MAENESLREDRVNKTITLSRCTETACNARDQMRMLKTEREENNLNMDKMGKKHEKEIKIRDEKLRRAEIKKSTRKKHR